VGTYFEGRGTNFSRVKQMIYMKNVGKYGDKKV
jgi:hypothetical protein